MAENLNYAIEDSECPDNEYSYCAEYGRKYTWTAALEVCPVGWHLPTLNEWDELIHYVGGNFIPELCKDPLGGGNKLRAGAPYWNGTDDYGFSILPDPLLHIADIWTKGSLPSLYYGNGPYTVGFGGDVVVPSTKSEKSKHSVRCVQDSEGGMRDGGMGDHLHH
jgi:uncharacterized protein (TIGR02145 family)